MSESLRRRIREHGRRDRRDAHFAERLESAVETIDRDFRGEEHARLLALAERTFERHVAVRDHTLRIRERLSMLVENQRLLGELLTLVAPRSRDESIH